MAGTSRQSTGRGDANELKIREYMENTGSVAGLVRFDTFTGKPILQRPVPRPGRTPDPNFVQRPWQDVDTTALVEHLQGQKFKKVKRSIVDHVVLLRAYDDTFSAAQERLELFGEVWDGEARLEVAFIEGLGVEDTPYHRAVSRCFFKSIVARVFRPGCKVDTMLVLEGPQGEGKSKLLRIIALDDNWFSDSLPHNLSSKDAKQHMLGKLIIEMSEIAQIDRSSTAALKAFLSAQDDKFRPPYGRHEVVWPRQGVLVGTTNDDQYLRDITGNRRYWPIACKAIDLGWWRRNIEQIYAEALVSLREHPVWWLENGEGLAAASEQDRRLYVDPWEELAREKLVELERTAAANGQLEFDVVVSEVLYGWFSVTIEKQDGKALDRVGKLLKSLGGLQVREMVRGVRKRCRRFKVGDVGRGPDEIDRGVTGGDEN